MTRSSANLGVLWANLPLPDAIRSAKSAGFDTVECHWPYDTDPDLINQALAETGLPMLTLNTRVGDVAAGDYGLAAILGREGEARAGIDEALDYAAQIGATRIHVMAGVAEGAAAQDTFTRILRYTCTQAASRDQIILIEPLNRIDATGDLLNSTQAAAALVADIAAKNLPLMSDCYHVVRSELDVLARLQAHFPIIGHIQFASAPDRGPPDRRC